MEATQYYSSSTPASKIMRKLTPYAKTETKKLREHLKYGHRGMVDTHRIPRQCQQMPLDTDAKLSPSPHKSAMKNFPGN